MNEQRLKEIQGKVESEDAMDGMNVQDVFSKDIPELIAEVRKLRASLGAIHFHARRTMGVMPSIFEECEYAVPELKELREKEEHGRVNSTPTTE